VSCHFELGTKDCRWKASVHRAQAVKSSAMWTACRLRLSADGAWKTTALLRGRCSTCWCQHQPQQTSSGAFFSVILASASLKLH